MSGTTEPDLFVDGLLDVSFSRGIVRLDLYSLSATEKVPNGGPKPEFRRRIVLSAQAFAEFANGIQLAAQSLRERGIVPGGPAPLRSVVPDAPAEEGQPVVEAPASADVVEINASRKKPHSPNFPVSALADNEG